MDENKRQLRVMVRSSYQLQKLRIQMGNRLVNSFKVKLGQMPGKPEDDLDSEGKEILKEIRRNYSLLASYVATHPKEPFKAQGDGLISTEAEYYLVQNYLAIESAEENNFAAIEKVLKGFPIYTSYLKHVKGIGPVMSSVIIAEIDIHIATTVSKMWAISGLDVAADGKGRSRRKEHLVKREYTDKQGEKQIKDSITFNPFLKTKLIGVLGSSFLRAGGPYADIYREQKHRLEHHAVYRDTSKGHRHAIAIRYAVKMFLKDLYVAWRSLEQLPVREPYVVEKLGIVHSGMQ